MMKHVNQNQRPPPAPTHMVVKVQKAYGGATTSRAHPPAGCLGGGEEAIGGVLEIEKQISEAQDINVQAKELNKQAQVALNERERLNRTLIMQRRLRKAQRELDEARLITSFASDAGATTSHPNVRVASTRASHPPPILAPLSMSSRLQDPTEPADSFPEQPEDAL